MHVDAWEGEKEPAGQGEQALDAMTEELPATQAAQVDEPFRG